MLLAVVLYYFSKDTFKFPKGEALEAKTFVIFSAKLQYHLPLSYFIKCLRNVFFCYTLYSLCFILYVG